MAHQTDYLCEFCGLYGIVSGGADSIMSGKTHTYYNPNTEELFDDLIPSEKADSLLPYRNIDNIFEWTEGQPCPRCGGNLALHPGPVTSIVLAD